MQMTSVAELVRIGLNLNIVVCQPVTKLPEYWACL